MPDNCSLKPMALPLPYLLTGTERGVMSMWKNLASVMEGEIVRLEPLARGHEERLFEAARDEKVWRWMHYDAGGSRERFHAWLEDALTASSAGTEAAFATVDAATG